MCHFCSSCRNGTVFQICTVRVTFFSETTKRRRRLAFLLFAQTPSLVFNSGTIEGNNLRRKTSKGFHCPLNFLLSVHWNSLSRAFSNFSYILVTIAPVCWAYSLSTLLDSPWRKKIYFYKFIKANLSEWFAFEVNVTLWCHRSWSVARFDTFGGQQFYC